MINSNYSSSNTQNQLQIDEERASKSDISVSKSNSWNLLPQEMLEEIFSYLSSRDRCYFSQTSKENYFRARWRKNNIDLLPQEMLAKIFSVLSPRDWYNFSQTTKRNKYIKKCLMNNVFFRHQQKEYIWLKDEKGNYQAYKIENMPVKKSEFLFSERAGTREEFLYRRVQIQGNELISSKCRLIREIRNFDLETIDQLTKLSKKFFVEAKGSKTTEKKSIFYYENWGYFLSDIYRFQNSDDFSKKRKIKREEVYKNRFKIFRNMLGALKELQSFPINCFNINDFVVIKNKDKDGKDTFDCKRRIPLWLGFDNGDGSTHSLTALDAVFDMRWMAPEIIHNRFDESLKESYMKSNVYSLGLVIWSIYTLSLPFKGENIAGFIWMNKVVNEGYRPDLSRETFPDLNEKEYTLLKELLEMTWKPKPEDRIKYKEIEKKLKDLENASRAA